jgi:pilus assembly protein FimV
MRGDAETIPDLDLSFPSSPPATRPGVPTASGFGGIPRVDLNLPSAVPPPPPQPAQTARPTPPPRAYVPPIPPTPAPVPAAASPLEEALSRPPEETAPRLTSNTDQATVPLIDFDLTGADLGMGGRKTETQAGSPMAAQMATKLDLARGYIDLGVKDGARELLEEVMRDGTREQRQQAVELVKLVDG